MKRNGRPRPRELHRDLAFESDARAATIPARLHALLWLRRWKHRPGRTFWIIGPTGERRLL